MKNLYGSAILEMVKKMQNTFRASNSLAELWKTMGLAYNNSIAGMAIKMQDAFIASSSLVDLGKSMGLAYNKSTAEMASRMQDTFRASNSLAELGKFIGLAYNNLTAGMASKMQDAFISSSSLVDLGKSMGLAYNKSTAEMASGMQDAFRASNSLAELGKSMGLAYNNLTAGMASKMQDAFIASSSLVDLGKSLTSSISYKIHKEHMSLASIVGNISPILDFYQQYPTNEIAVREDQTIVYGSESINIDSLNDIIHDILISIGIQNNYLLKIVEEIHKLKKPFLEKIVVWIIIPLLISILSPFINQSIKYYYNYYFHDNKQIFKYIKKELAKNDIDFKLLRTYRIVSIDELIVRERNRKASKLIGKVYFGQIVKVIDKKKNWSLIEWKGNDETTELVIRGWVFSRYLKKFN